ncbi:dihydrofolate reductase [filamentous cyanobacterium LEGE 11480]|uniref:Dihydrofolate reductase n=1 Tax=Romeriopsis navalis LEGE 11480 TaxID=2777977 RepID=A0A928VQR0_9CYAN|nr:dihydrofolate reductase family protein [Romeriopsis navalis]MBE9030369.1 dihydrofolate reductase [Romeriopsis navalis LEGE 11480]
MKPQISVFIATSLDGFIARENGDLDWLDAANATVPADEDCGYAAFMAEIDTLVMGRNTYEQVLSFGQWPYGDMPVVVLSRNLIDFPARLPDTISHSAETPEALCDRLAAKGIKHIYVDGGITIQRFLAAGLVDQLIITVIPTILGVGKPLFGPLTQDIQLQCISTKAFEFGFVQLHYKIAPAISIE